MRLEETGFLLFLLAAIVLISGFYISEQWTNLVKPFFELFGAIIIYFRYPAIAIALLIGIVIFMKKISRVR